MRRSTFSRQGGNSVVRSQCSLSTMLALMSDEAPICPEHNVPMRRRKVAGSMVGIYQWKCEAPDCGEYRLIEPGK